MNEVLFKPFLDFLRCFEIEIRVNAQIGGLDVNFYISNKGVHKLDVELRYVVIILGEKMQFCQLKQNVFEESYLDFEMS